MYQYTYDIFEFILLFPYEFGLPVNIGVLMLPFAAPPLTLLRGVDRSARVHVARIIGAVVITFVLIMLANHSERILEWLQRRACLEQLGFPDQYSEAAKPCGFGLDLEDAVKIALIAAFSPWVAALYVGLLEGIWRLWHWRKIRKMGAQFEGRFFSNAIIVAPIVMLCLFVLLLELGRA